MANTTLDDAVKTAVAENPPVETTEQKVEATETKTEQKGETKVEPTAEEIAYQEKVDKAVRLFDALSDPNVGRSVVEELARKAGVIGAAEGKSDRQIAKTVLDVFKEHLGTEYEWMAERIAPAIDQIVKQTVAEQIKPVQLQATEAQERAIKADVDKSFAVFESKHKDAKEVEKDMLEMSKRHPFNGEYPMEEYLEDIYKLVTVDKKEAKVIKTTVDKINKNAQELRDSSTEVQETRVTKGSKLPSLNEAVAAAFRNERLF